MTQERHSGARTWLTPLTERVTDIIARVRYLLTQFSLGRWEELSRLELILVYPSILILQVFRELIRDRGLVRASSLAFTTALSVVPVMTVATTLSTAFGVGDQALMRLLKSMMPVSADTIAAQLSEFSQHQGGTMGGIGSVVIIFLGVALFNNIEHAFNDIWRIRKRRPFLNKFLTFYALITLAPLMITISVVESARVQILMDELPFFSSVAYKLIPLGLGMVAFTIANKLLPYTEVNFVPAIVSGAVTAIAFELAKAGFNIYITEFVMESYTTVYGALSLIPIFMVWVYLTWVIVLFGAELTYTIQNLRYLLLPQRLHDINVDKQRRFAPLVGLEVFAPIAEAFKQSHGPIQMPRIAAIAGVPTELARQVIARLVKARLIFEVEYVDTEGASTGYIPARPLGDIPMMDVINACREAPDEEDQSRFMRTLVTLHNTHERNLFGQMTCAGIIDEDDPERLRLLAMAVANEIDADLPHPRRARKTPKPTPSLPSGALAERMARAANRVRDNLDAPNPIDALASLDSALPDGSHDDAPDSDPTRPRASNGSATPDLALPAESNTDAAASQDEPGASPFDALAQPEATPSQDDAPSPENLSPIDALAALSSPDPTTTH